MMKGKKEAKKKSSLFFCMLFIRISRCILYVSSGVVYRLVYEAYTIKALIYG